MAHVVTMVVYGVAEFARTLWALRERRWSHTFDAVTSAAVSVTMTFMFCFLSIHNHRQRRAGNDIVFASLLM